MRFSAAFLGFVIVGTPALADQCAWLTKAQADTALKSLAKGAVIQEYCAPCKDAKAKKTVVQSTTLKTQDPTSVTIVANGDNELDIAYVYVGGTTGRKVWTNLGMLAKCDVSDVPKDLPANLVAP